jgi:hypothetical protein
LRNFIGDDATKVVNAVVSVALDGSGDVQVLAKGNDFYAAPRKFSNVLTSLKFSNVLSSVPFCKKSSRALTF